MGLKNPVGDDLFYNPVAELEILTLDSKLSEISKTLKKNIFSGWKGGQNEWANEKKHSFAFLRSSLKNFKTFFRIC
jgi:hypothetical protein